MALVTVGSEMVNDDSFAPRQYLGVMVSSNFRYLQQHRAALMRAIEGQGLHAVAMEHDAALPDGTVIDSSLRKVRDAAAYIGIIGHAYGNIPDSAESNPDHLSLTEMEFREARRLGRPMLIFIMGADHDVKLGDVERDLEKVRKLEAFREDAKRVTSESNVHRVYQEFNSLSEFSVAAVQSVAELRRLLDLQVRLIPSAPIIVPDGPGHGDASSIPAAPTLYAEPQYFGSHPFVGRAAELGILRDWAARPEPHPILLFEAIGGTGKSMLTWEWTVNHASDARTDWAGRFWYSFYEKGAVMADFCRRALAYMTDRPLEAFDRKRQSELSRLLQQQLQARPWLLVLDGLERVLVAYHRYDAAQVTDEDAGRSDQIGRRDPSAAIRPEDDELLHALAVGAPSKVLITSRLMPRALLNSAGQPMPGVLYQRLPGLRPVDAEALLRACGVRGDSRAIQAYLQQHCDCHPLVTGILASLVSDYLPDRGHFDAWANDPEHGGRLNLAKLDLIQKRNHILKTAMDALPDESRQLLSTLALLSEAVDYDTLTALNPHLPPPPERPPKPERPEDLLVWWNLLAPAGKQKARQEYTIARERLAEYERDYQGWLDSPEYQASVRELTGTVRDMERRGLLQYDQRARRYDLHPVVRGFASGSLRAEDRDRLGQLAVDYFSQRVHDPYEQAEALNDVQNGLQLVRTLLQIGRKRDAFTAYHGDLASALLINLEAAAEVLSLLRPFFTQDWRSPSAELGNDDFCYLANNAAIAFRILGQLEQSFALQEAALKVSLKKADWHNSRISLAHIAQIFADQNCLARSYRCGLLGLELAESLDDEANLFRARLNRFRQITELGQWADAEAIWQMLDPMGRNWQRDLYRPGMAEEAYARFRFRQGQLTEDLLAEAERLARLGRNRTSSRSLYALRGDWHLERQEWALAAESFNEAIRMVRETRMSDTYLETRLALARFRLGQLSAARQEVIRLAARAEPAQLALAELWHAIGDPGQVAEYAQAAYRWAWADGEPYAHRYQLDRAASLLMLVRAEIPALPAYNPVSDQPLAFEYRVQAAIKELRAGPRMNRGKRKRD